MSTNDYIFHVIALCTLSDNLCCTEKFTLIRNFTFQILLESVFLFIRIVSDYTCTNSTKINLICLFLFQIRDSQTILGKRPLFLNGTLDPHSQINFKNPISSFYFFIQNNYQFKNFAFYVAPPPPLQITLGIHFLEVSSVNYCHCICYVNSIIKCYRYNAN